MELKIGERVGGGGFADVWRATDNLGRTVAVKFFRDSGSRDEQLALDHARALARVKHPRLVQVLALEEHTNPETGREQQAIVMDLIDGPTLDTLPSVSPEDAKRLGCDVIDGLAAVHDAGLVHGDLHDENVLVSAGRATVIDILYRLSLADVGARTAKRSRDDDYRDLVQLVRLILDKAGEAIDDVERFVANVLSEPRELRRLRDLYVAFFEADRRTIRKPSPAPARMVEHSHGLGLAAYRWGADQVCIELRLTNETWTHWWVAVPPSSTDALVKVSACAPGTPRTYGTFMISGPHASEDGRIVWDGKHPSLSPVMSAYAYLRTYPEWLELGRWDFGAFKVGRTALLALPVQPCP